MPRLAVTLLGGFAVAVEGRPVQRFESDRVRALLAYLALPPGRAHSRAHLADLLWPGQPADAARANLRNTLSRLRHALDDHDPRRPLILADQRTVALAAGPEVVCDAAHFVALADRCAAHEHWQLEACRTCAPQFREAAELYQGALLGDLSLSHSPHFEEWLLASRARLEQQALELFGALARAAEASGNAAQLQLFARRQLVIEPWREQAHRQLMLGLALGGERGAALAQYRQLQTLLAHELRLEPEAATRELYERIRTTTQLDTSGGSANPRFRLPAPLTPLVGREGELAALRAHHGWRLLTLTGMGGIGKTRLALELARGELAAFSHGVYFVDLAPLQRGDSIVSAIGAALDLVLHGDPEAALINALRNKQLLLILDNCEHVLDDLGIVAAILEAAPQVQILATSRERLNLRGEQVYLVEGLAYRAEGDEPLAAEPPAVRLFVQCARRVMPSFALDEEQQRAVLQICRLLEGLPLGLELAAARADALSPAEIAAELSRSSRFLEGGWRDVHPHQRSLHAAFDWSWRLLGSDEQQALCRLTIFRGGWTREAAEEVVAVSHQHLLLLLRKSLLRRDGDGRYSLLEPLRQLAAERLPANVAHAVAERHCAYYLELMAAQVRQLSDEQPHRAIATIRRELDNVHHAWFWAVANGQARLLEASLYAFKEFYLWTGLLGEVICSLEAAAERLREAADAPHVAAARSRMLGLVAGLQLAQGRYTLAAQRAEEAVAISVRLGSREGEAHARLVLGVTQLVQGPDAGVDELQRALTIARAAMDCGVQSDLPGYDELQCCYWLAWACHRRCDFTAAQRWAAEGLAVSRRLGRQRGEISCLYLMALVARDADDGAGLERCAEQLAAAARVSSYPRAEGLAMHIGGELLARQGRYVEARAHLERAVRLLKAIGDDDQLALALASLCRLDTSLGATSRALAQLDQLDRLRAAGIGHHYSAEWALTGGLLAVCRAAWDEALVAARSCVDLARQSGERLWEAQGYLLLGRALEQLGDPAAGVAYQHALDQLCLIGHQRLVADAQAGLARLALAIGTVVPSSAPTRAAATTQVRRSDHVGC
ncbi:MAG: winged helix-turn-helix domain-containing protein [Chloroflexi bacterium]|nr:winged helix-turn-helix domain-containing protein [Chloroflexota bacterium]